MPCAVIFGANASGKSIVYKAFVFMRVYVLNSFSYGGDDSVQSMTRPWSYPFRFNEQKIESKHKTSSWNEYALLPFAYESNRT
ncbi:MAG: AAA family ATPase [Planctomycetia bacterium]|nr:AAA family ATPase [Planctomycetia bacterium]